MEIIEKQALIVVGLPVRANWPELYIEMPKAWELFRARYTEIAYRQDGTFVDVSLDKIGEEYLQLVCTRVSQVGPIPSGMRAIKIPAQQYVHHRHIGPIISIAESFGRIYDWAREHGHPVSQLKVDSGYTVEGDELEHNLYVGLLPRKQWHDVQVV